MTSAPALGPLPPSVASRYPHGYAIVDVETSGLNPGSHRVLQVAVSQMRPDGALESTWSTLLDPGCDPGPVQIHGLTRAKLAGSPQFDQVCSQLVAMLAGRVFVAHNASFDWRFIAAETQRAGAVVDTRGRLCTIAMTRRLDLPTESLKLAAVARYWGVRQYAAHDAADDTRVTVEILRHSLVVADRLNLRLPLALDEDARRPTAYPPRAPRVPCPWKYAGRLRPGGTLQQGMKVAITGPTRQPRESLIRSATGAGLEVMNSVSSLTSLLVRNPGAPPNDKSVSGTAHGTTVVDESQFLTMLTAVAPGEPKTSPAITQPAAAPTPAPRARQLPAPRGPLARRRILVLGGPHERATAVRARIAELGGQAAANLTASVTGIVLLDGHLADPRWGRVTKLALPILSPADFTPMSPTTELPPAATQTVPRLGTPSPSAPTMDAATVLSRGAVIDLPAGQRWTVDVSWSSAAGAARDIVIDVVALVVDADEQVDTDEDLVFYNQPQHPSSAVDLTLDVPSEAQVDIDLAKLPPYARRVTVAAAIDGTATFGELGPVELTLRDSDGRGIARATLDAAVRERSMLLCSLYERGGRWRFRAIGQGYTEGLDHLAVLHGVDVQD